MGVALLGLTLAAACLWREKPAIPEKESVREQMSRLVGQVPPCPCFSTLHLGKASKAGSGLLGEVAFSSTLHEFPDRSPSFPQQSTWRTLDTVKETLGWEGELPGGCT